MSFLSPTDLLGFKGANKERISLLNHNKSRGVNISLLKPKGWIIEEGDRPHIVQKYINPGRTTIYMVQINELPTFVSRNEVESELNDDSFGWNEMISNEIFNSSSDVKIISMDNDLVDRYPAKSYTYTALVDMKGLKVSMFAKTWYVFYEDRLVILWGLTMFPEDKEEQIKFELLFDIITNQVQFPEQYIETSYER
jgi:hypothetical protein